MNASLRPPPGAKNPNPNRIVEVVVAAAVDSADPPHPCAAAAADGANRRRLEGRWFRNAAPDVGCGVMAERCWCRGRCCRAYGVLEADTPPPEGRAPEISIVAAGTTKPRADVARASITPAASVFAATATIFPRLLRQKACVHGRGVCGSKALTRGERSRGEEARQRDSYRESRRLRS